MSGSTWKKPEDVMRLMREKKRALQNRFRNAGPSLCSDRSNSNCDSANREASMISNPAKSSIAVKRKNPFRCSPSKKPKLQKSDTPESTETLLPFKPASEASLFQQLNDTVLPHETTASSKSNVLEHPSVLFTAPPQENEKLEQCAVDWSLKTRIRFTSRTKFTFSTTLKTSEEASGITGFVRCVNSGGTEELSSLDTSTNAQFHQCCLYWQYPWLPWMSLFPRDSRTPVTSPTTTSNIGMDPHISNSLLHDWCENFRSLFGLLRARQCPYFYVCTHQFNVLFRAAGIGGVEETHALMTPTTKGLRDILRRDDIQFSMPLRKSSHGETNQPESSGTSTKANNDGDDDDGDDEDEDNEDDWISDIGLQSNLRSKLEAERLQDGGQGTSQGLYHDSLILIEDTETQGLFNWLMNSKLCLSNTGPLAGIPPTLLSPVAFHGATLRPLKVRQGLLKQDGENMYSLEVQGPILPHSVVSLMNLLQTADYKTIFSVVTSTKPFAAFQNGNSSGASAFGKENLSDCGLDGKALDLFCSSQPFPTTKNEISFKNGSFYFGS